MHLSQLWTELCFAARELRKAPLYSATAVVTLSCAVAANAAIFGAAQAVLFTGDAIRNPDELVVAWQSAPERNQRVVEVTYRQFLEWRTSPFITQLAVIGSSHWGNVIEDRDEPLELAATGVSQSFFDTLGVQPSMGRSFTRDDDQPKSGCVAILSDGAWRTHFGGEPRAVGRTFTTDGKVCTIVGVMPGTFDFPRGTDLWIPVVPVLTESSTRYQIDALQMVGVLLVVGRRAPGIELEALRADFDRLAVPLESDGSERTAATPFEDYVLGPVRAGLWWLLGAVAALLLVACANLSGIALTRASARRHEQAVLLALGATRSRLGRRWVLEALLLAVISATLGLAASTWVMRGLVSLAPDVPRLATIHVSFPVAAFTVGLAFTITVLCSGAPMLAVRAVGLAEALNDAARGSIGSRPSKLRGGLVTAQIALAFVVLVAAGLVVRSFAALQGLDLGFQPDRVAMIQVEPRGAAGREGRWFEDVSRALTGLRGIDAAGAVYLRPLALGAIGFDAGVLLPGQPETAAAASRNPRINFQVATTSYFAAMRTPLVRGRTFDERDGSDAAPVTVIGESAARALWPGEDPIGKRMLILTGSPRADSIWRTVVGVVHDVHYRGIGDVRLDVYEAAAQSEQHPKLLIVRGSASPLDAVAAARMVMREMDSRAVVGSVDMLDDVVHRALAPWRLTGWMLGAVAVFTIVLTMVGLVGQLGVELAQRSREFALRLAMGAQTRHIRAHVLLATARRMTIGVALGLAAAIGMVQSARGLLFGVSSFDPTTWGLVTATICIVVAATSYFMAGQATNLNLVSALNSEARR